MEQSQNRLCYMEKDTSAIIWLRCANIQDKKFFAKSWTIDTVAKAIENQDRTPTYLAAVWNTSAANTPQDLHIRTPEDLEANKKSRWK